MRHLSMVNHPRRPASWLASGVLVLALVILGIGLHQNSPAQPQVPDVVEPLIRGADAVNGTPTGTQLQGPGSMERQVTLTVRTLLERDHLLEMKVNDTVAQRALKNYLTQLDPMKMYFYKADIDQFTERQNQLDDALQRGDISFAYDAFKVFLQRVDERVALIHELLDGSFDFTEDEELVTDRDLRAYPADEAEARDLWRKRLKYDILVLKADEKTDEEARERLHRRYTDFARRMHQIKDDDLLEWYLTAFGSAFDPHTNYMSKSSLEDFQISMRLNLEGIGAALRSEDGYVVIDRVIPGGAAAKQGQLKPKDQIVSVGEGEEGEMVDVINASLKDVVNLIRGKAGTIVRLGVKPGGTGEVKIYTITRAKIELRDSEAQAKVFEAGRKSDGSPYKIGVIDLPSFYMDMEAASRRLTNFKSTTRDVMRLLDDFKKQGVDAVVLDLRQNGGGSLTEAVNMTGLFIEEGPVVQVKDSADRVQQYDDTRPEMAWSGPLVVVTSKLSASASEILAGAIQDYGRGLVVGDTSTHGKGTVQHLLEVGSVLFPGVPNIPNLGALKITIQKFYRPSGMSTQLKGVMADVVLPSITDHWDIGEEDLDYAIPFDTVKAAEHKNYGLVSPEFIDKLTQLSEQRRSKSEEFQKRIRDIELYRKQKERKRIPLNEEKFLEMRKELDAQKEDERMIEEQVNPTGEGIERDFYLDEVLAIAADYVSLLEGTQKLANLNAAAATSN